MLILIAVLIANQHRVPSSEAKVRPLVIGGGPKTMFLAGIVSQSSWGEPLWNTKCIKQREHHQLRLGYIMPKTKEKRSRWSRLKASPSKSMHFCTLSSRSLGRLSISSRNPANDFRKTCGLSIFWHWVQLAPATSSGSNGMVGFNKACLRAQRRDAGITWNNYRITIE